MSFGWQSIGKVQIGRDFLASPYKDSCRVIEVTMTPKVIDLTLDC